MSKSNKTGAILKDKNVNLPPSNGECQPCKAKQQQLENSQQKVPEIPIPENSTCEPCKAKNSIWKVAIHNNDIFNTDDTEKNLKLIGDALQQFAKFTAPQVQAVFTSMGILPSEWHPIYSGEQNIALTIHNELAKLGLTPRVEAALKNF